MTSRCKRILAIITFMAATSLVYAGTPLRVVDAWIPQAPPVAGVMAAYFKIENTGDKPVVVSGISCDAFADVMMHKTVEKDGMSRMIHQDQVRVGAHSSVAFTPGGLHLMLMSPKHPLKPGDKVSMILHTANKKSIPFTAVVRSADLGEDSQK